MVLCQVLALFNDYLTKVAHVNGWGRNIMQVHLSQSRTRRYAGRGNEVDEQFDYKGYTPFELKIAGWQMNPGLNRCMESY